MEWFEDILFETEQRKGSKVIASMQPPDPPSIPGLENASYSHIRFLSNRMGRGGEGQNALVKSLACTLILQCSSESPKTQEYLCKIGKE
jgi:hypothetical protein